jgi:hypothetical protein
MKLHTCSPKPAAPQPTAEFNKRITKHNKSKIKNTSSEVKKLAAPKSIGESTRANKIHRKTSPDTGSLLRHQCPSPFRIYRTFKNTKTASQTPRRFWIQDSVC